MTPKLAAELSDFCVRLSSNNKCIGSGILFRHEGIFFVITAKHCVFNEAENTYIDSINIDRWDAEFGMVSIAESVDKSNVFFDDENTDIALLEIGDSNRTNIHSVSFCSSLPVNHENFFFQGFPKGLESQRPKTIECIFERQTSNGFSLTSTTSLEDNTTTSRGNVKNFSGSGVLFEYLDEIYLVGTVTDYKNEFSEFDGINLYPIINLLLQKANCKPIFTKDIKRDSINKSDSTDLLSFFKNRVSRIDDYIQSFKPQTALLELEDLKLNIELSNLAEKKELFAECAFLEGLSYKLLGEDVDKIETLFLEAIEFDNTNLKYKQLEPFILYRKGLQEESLSSAKSILLEDSRNVRAWAVSDYIQNRVQGRQDILKDDVYKAYTLSLFLKDKYVELVVADDFDPLLFDDLTNEVYPQEIDLANINYWILFAQYTLQRFIKSPYNQKTFIDAFHSNPKLPYASKLFNIIYEKVQGDEVRTNRNFSMARFYKYFTDFICYNGSSEFDRKGIIQKMFHEMKVADISSLNPSIKVYIILSMISLDGFEKETLDVANEIDISENIAPEIFFWCAEICERLKDIDKLKHYLCKHLESLSTIQNEELTHVIGVFEILNRHDVGYDEQIQILNKIKAFENPKFRELLLINIDSFDAKLDTETNVFLDNFANEVDFDSPPLKIAIAICYFRIGKHQKSKNQFDIYIDRTKLLSDANLLPIYIRLLTIAVNDNWATEVDKKFIFELLQTWRKNFPFREQFNYNELNSAFAIKNYKLAQEVAEYGLIHSQEKAFYTAQLIDSLCFQHERTEEVQQRIDGLLTYDLFEINFTEQQKLNIISHLFDNDKHQIAIEFFYKLVTENPSRKDLKEKYISNQYMLGNSWDKYFPNPEMVGESNYVKYMLNGDEYYEQIVYGETDDYIYTFLIDKPIGKYEKTNFDEGSKNVVEVIEINHKCIGLKNTIYKQIINGNELRSGGLKVRHFEYKENGELDIEDFNRQLQELSGVSGTKRELYWDELINKYRNIEAGFLDISRFQGSPFTTYDYITHHLYFPTLPICNHNPPKIIADTNFILDFTSLNLFVDLSSQSIVNFEQLNFRFKMTQSMYNYVESELKKAKSERSDSISLSVTLNHVRPIFSNDEYVQRNISRIEKVFKWMKLYCEVEGFSEEKLSIFLEMDKSNVLKDRDDLANIYIETLILSMNDNTLIISDDSNFFKRVPNTISSEYFLSSFNLKSNESQSRMLELNYRSLTVNADTLHHLFNKNKFTNHIGTSYDRALKYSLTDWNPISENVLQSLFFLKKIHLEGLSGDFKTKISMDIFYALLSSSYISVDEIRRQVVIFLDKEFNLLQLDKITLFASFEAVARGVQHQ